MFHRSSIVASVLLFPFPLPCLVSNDFVSRDDVSRVATPPPAPAITHPIPECRPRKCCPYPFDNCAGVTLKCDDAIFSLMTRIKLSFEHANIPYSLGYGTLLGAVRDHDVQPWTGDADFYVTRDNYKKMAANNAMWRDEPFNLQVHHTEDGHGFARVCDWFANETGVQWNKTSGFIRAYADLFPVCPFLEGFLNPVKGGAGDNGVRIRMNRSANRNCEQECVPEFSVYNNSVEIPKHLYKVRDEWFVGLGPDLAERLLEANYDSDWWKLDPKEKNPHFNSGNRENTNFKCPDRTGSPDTWFP